MSNELSVLRFYSDDEPAPPVEVSQLSRLCDALVNIYGVTASSTYGDDLKARVSIAAPPTRGCLELPLLISFSGTPTHHLIELANQHSKDLQLWSGPASFLWIVLFGGRGLIDLFLRHGGSAPSRREELKVPHAQIAEEEMAYWQQSPEVPAAVQDLEAAASGPYKRVTIEASGTGEVPIFPARGGYDLLPLAEQVGRSVPEAGRFPSGASVRLRRLSYEQVPAMRPSGETVQLFTAVTGSQIPVLVVWLSESPLPEIGTEITARTGPPISMMELELPRHIPRSFMQTEAAVSVVHE